MPGMCTRWASKQWGPGIPESLTSHTPHTCSASVMETAWRKPRELNSLHASLRLWPYILCLLLLWLWWITWQPAHDACLSRLEAGWGLRPWPWCLSPGPDPRRGPLDLTTWSGNGGRMNIPFPWTRPDFVSCDASPPFQGGGLSGGVSKVFHGGHIVCPWQAKHRRGNHTKGFKESREEKRHGLSSHLTLSTSLSLKLPLSLHVPG